MAKEALPTAWWSAEGIPQHANREPPAKAQKNDWFQAFKEITVQSLADN